MMESPNQVDLFSRLVAERVVDMLRNDLNRASPWMTPADAAQYLSLSVRGLEDMRAQSAGPRHHKINHRIVRYHRADLDCWLLSDGQLDGRPE